MEPFVYRTPCCGTSHLTLYRYVKHMAKKPCFGWTQIRSVRR